MLLLLVSAVVVSMIALFAVGIQLWAPKATSDALRLRKINAIVGAVHLASSVALSWLSVAEEPWSAPVTFVESSWQYAAENQTSCSGDLKCFAQFELVRSAADIEVAVVAVLFGVISGVGHMVCAFFAEYSLESAESGFNLIRWGDYSLSASLMIIVLSAICGVTDGYTLVLVALLQCSLLLVAMLAEMVICTELSRPSVLSQISKAAAVGASVLYLGMWAPAYGTIAASQAGDGAKPPWFVWIIIGALFLLFSSFAGVYFWYINAPQPRVSSELRYIALSLTAKIALHWTLYVSILSRTGMLYDSRQEAIDAEGSEDTSTVTMRVGTVAGGAIVAGIISAVLIDAYFYGWGVFKRCDSSRPIIFFVRNDVYASSGL